MLINLLNVPFSFGTGAANGIPTWISSFRDFLLVGGCAEEVLEPLWADDLRLFGHDGDMVVTLGPVDDEGYATDHHHSGPDFVGQETPVSCLGGVHTLKLRIEFPGKWATGRFPALALGRTSINKGLVSSYLNLCFEFHLIHHLLGTCEKG